MAPDSARASSISPDANVSPEAVLGHGVRIGPGVLVEAEVEIGADTILLPGTILHSGTRVGARCRIGPYAVIGGEPMDRGFRGEPSFVRLGDEVVVREFSTVHRATGPDEETVVEEGAFLMCYVHLGHNAHVGEGAVLTNNVQLGGHARVGGRAVLGGGAMVHQFTRVGAFAMVGGGSTVTKDVLPYALAQGTPARHFRANRVGLERHGMDASVRRRLDAALRHLRRGERDAFEALAAEHEDVAAIRDFLASSRRGVARFAGSG